MLKMILSALLFVSLAACRKSEKEPQAPRPAPAKEAGNPPIQPAAPEPAKSTGPSPSPAVNGPDLKTAETKGPEAVVGVGSSEASPAVFVIPMPALPSPSPDQTPERPKESTRPVAPQFVVGQSMDYSEREVIRNRNGFNFIPIVKSAGFTVYARTWEDRISESATIPVIKVPKGRSIDDEFAKLNVAFMAKTGAAGYRSHFVRRGVELRDGSFLFVSVNASNMGSNMQHDHYRQAFVIKTNSDLQVVSSFGANGVIALESLGTNMNYRFVRKIIEEPNGDLYLFEKRSLREGLGYLQAPDECYKIKFNKMGKIDTKHGKKGYLTLPSCEGI